MLPSDKYNALDNDLYKFTMQQAVLHKYPDARVKYRFKLRNPEMVNQIDRASWFRDISTEIDRFCDIRFTDNDLSYLRSIRFMKPDYIDFLEDFTFKRRYIDLKMNSDALPEITIEGPWVQTILFEVPLLYIVSETYSQKRTTVWNTLPFIKETVSELSEYSFPYADFGTRRRFSWTHHYLLIEQLAKTDALVGTSNVLLAKQFGLKPIGTMAHEWLQAHQALFRVQDSQKEALDAWASEYRGDLGIALSDVVGFNAFLEDFDLYFSKLFDGCRHDSGDPFEWCDKLIQHYEMLGINPKTKIAVFSDGLDFKKANDLYVQYKDQINVSFGIGTHLTNRCDFTPLQIVLKMVECNGKPVAKISDSSGKGMCEDDNYLDYLKYVFNIGE